MGEVVANLALDTFGLEEVQAGALDRLVDSVRAHGLELDFILQNEPGAQDLAVLFDTDTTKVKHRTDILDDFDEQLSRRIANKSVFPRKPLFAECEVGHKESGTKVRYLKIVVHLKAFFDDTSRLRRREAARALREIIDALRADDDSLSIVLGGDFNEFLSTDVLGDLTDSPSLFAMTADDDASGAASFIGAQQSLIDHIIVSSDVRTAAIEGDDTAIVRLDQSVRNFDGSISDHVPLVFRMVFDGGRRAAARAEREPA